MTHDEALDLAKRIINAWHGGPALAQWVEELEGMDAGQAGTTFVRLRRELEHAPSIARFYAEYRALSVHDGSNRPSRCHHCGDSGWVESSRHEFKGHVYTGCEPCSHCPEGQRQRGSTTWQNTGMRHFISDPEAERLGQAERQRHKPPKVDA